MSKLLIPFSKYQGAGNDFILVDDRSSWFPLEDQILIRKLCSRHFGVGSDGLILLQTSTKADFRMRIFNADGKEAAMCGNGLRCLVLYLKDLGITQETLWIQTQKEVLFCFFDEDAVGLILPPPRIYHFPLKIQADELFVLDTGVPHAVIFVSDVEIYPVEERGIFFRNHPQFHPEGVNVNFVEISSQGVLKVRTYERGVEAETLACGTGAAAAAYTFASLSSLQAVSVITKSQEILDFSFQEDKKIKMLAKASYVFSGEIFL